MTNIKKNIINRVIEESNFIIETKKTIREIANTFQVSKSTVHKDLNERLKNINYKNYEKVKEIFNEHISIRHINGGEATRLKYINIKD